MWSWLLNCPFQSIFSFPKAYYLSDSYSLTQRSLVPAKSVHSSFGILCVGNPPSGYWNPYCSQPFHHFLFSNPLTLTTPFSPSALNLHICHSLPSSQFSFLHGYPTTQVLTRMRNLSPCYFN